MIKSSRHQKDWFKLLWTNHQFKQGSNKWEKDPKTTIHVLSLKATSLDVDELFWDKVLLNLFTSIYIYRLALTWRKAYILNKVSMYTIVV